jgi:exopolysaccharide production protein ExoQ
MNTGAAAQFAPRVAEAKPRRELSVPSEHGATQPLLVIPFSVGFYFSFRTIVTLIVVRLFLQESRMGVAASLTIEFLLLLIAAFQAVGPSIRPLGWLFHLSSFRWVLAFLAFAGCSLAWSRTVSLPASFLYWCGLVGDVTLVVLLLRVAPVEAVAHSLMKGFIWATCLLALIAWMMPVGSDLRLGDPEYFNTNQIGNLCTFAIFQAQYLMCRKEWRSKSSIIFLIITLVRSLSKTTLVAFVASEIYLIARDGTISRKAKMGIAGSALLVVLIFWGLFQSYYSVYTTTGNQAQTLTGRLAIWGYSLDAALERPWVGNGFDSMWKVFPPFGSDQFEARHAENELLQQFFAYGIAGVVMLCGLYGSLLRSIRHLMPGPIKTIFISILLFIFIRGFAEAEPFDLLLPLWAMTVIGSIVAASLSSEQSGGHLRSTDANSEGMLLQLRKGSTL